MGHWAMRNAGNTDIHTPNLDRLARRGVKFDNFFCASPVCSPARASILTGTMPSCHGILDWLDGGSMDRASLSRESLEYMPHETIPIQYTDHLTAYTDILAAGGYRCALSGKWHMGDSMTPQHGFSHWYTIGGGGVRYFNPETIENGVLSEKKGYITDLIGEDALRCLDRFSKEEAPFYLSVHFTAPHSPWEETDHKKEYLDLKEESREVRIEGLKSETRGKLADFCLRVQYRYLMLPGRGRSNRSERTPKDILTALWN